MKGIALFELVEQRGVGRRVGKEALTGGVQSPHHHAEFRPRFAVHDGVSFDGCRTGWVLDQRGLRQRVQLVL